MTEQGMITLLDGDAMRRAISRIAYEIIERVPDLDDLVLCGIKTRGAYLAKRLADKISEVEKREISWYEVDVSHFRDDRHRQSTEEVKSHATLGHAFAQAIENKTIILVDDVLFTGRTVRAALDALTSTARPSLIQLAVLIDRGHRELPIRPDYIGKNIPTAKSERVVVKMKEVDALDTVFLKK